MLITVSQKVTAEMYKQIGTQKVKMLPNIHTKRNVTTIHSL